jgi:hypothetical protein
MHQYSEQQGFNRVQLKEQSNRDFAAREQESKKRYWEEQNQIYKEACDAAATIAGGNSLEEIKEERKKFRRLYWGIMSLVENRSVEGAMVDFGSGSRPVGVNQGQAGRHGETCIYDCALL